MPVLNRPTLWCKCSTHATMLRNNVVRNLDGIQVEATIACELSPAPLVFQELRSEDLSSHTSWTKARLR